MDTIVLLGGTLDEVQAEVSCSIHARIHAVCPMFVAISGNFGLSRDIRLQTMYPCGHYTVCRSP